jgi:hypothetical protein
LTPVKKIKHSYVDETNSKINKPGTLTVHEWPMHPGLRLSFMQLIHNVIHFACPENTSSKRAMIVLLVVSLMMMRF